MDSLNVRFRAINQKYRLRFLNRAFQFTGCFETSKDIVQEAYMSAIKVLRTLSEEALNDDTQVIKLIFHCISLRSKDWYRTKGRRPRVIHNHLPEKSITQGETPFELLKDLVDRAKLTADEKFIFEKLLMGFKIREIAAELEVTPKQLSNKKYHALLKIRQVFTQSSDS